MDIRKLRVKAGLSQAELARRVNVTPGYISHLETGRSVNPGLQVIQKIAIALDVPVARLIENKAS